MTSKTFVLGAGFSRAAKFPLVRELKDEVIKFVNDERHPSYAPILDRGEFDEVINNTDPDNNLGFEELLIKLIKQAKTDNTVHPTLEILKTGCVRLFWSKQNSTQAPLCYDFFARKFFKEPASHNNAIVSFNWDLVIEQSLEKTGAQWSYWTDNGLVPVLKPHGSINWSSHLNFGTVPTYSGWRKIFPYSKFSFDRCHPFSDPDLDNSNSQFRYALYPGDPDGPSEDNDRKCIWSAIEKTIESRVSLVFIGYSLPEYDSYAAGIFKKFAATKEVEVYNPSEEHLANFKKLSDKVCLFQKTFDKSPYGGEESK